MTAVEFEVQRAANEQFMALLAHELRSPLTPLRNAAMALDQLELGDPRGRWARAVIKRQVRTLTDLVQTFVDISSLGSSVTERHAESSFHSACTKALRAAGERAAQYDIKVEVACSIPVIQVRFEVLALERVMGIALDYAVNQTIMGGHITVHARLEGPTAVLEVCEHHRGVSEQEGASLFDLHDIAHSAPDSMHGVRVALYLAKQLTERYGGSLQCHSKGLGHGSALELRVSVA